MSKFVPIHEISTKFGITSRTLRYWEKRGLIKSSRDPQSNWRVYDRDAIEVIRLVTLLRELDLSIKAVKLIIDTKELETVKEIFHRQIMKLKREQLQSLERKQLLNKCYIALTSFNEEKNWCNWIPSLASSLAAQLNSKQSLKIGWEEMVMTNSAILSGALRIVSLPKMRVAVCNVISEAPEEEALNKVLEWAKYENLMGTARIFGFNTTAYSPESTVYGWAASITVPEAVKIPDFLEQRYFPGGLYASLNSTNEVYDSWQTLMKLLKESNEFTVDKERPCLEEHILSGEGQGMDFYLTLLEPVKRLQ